MKRYTLLPIIMSALLSANTFDQSKFIPDIALIVDMGYATSSLDDTKTEQLYENNSLYMPNGFHLNYAELSMHSDVDPDFELDGVFHYHKEGVEIEEAYFTTTSPDFIH